MLIVKANSVCYAALKPQLVFALHVADEVFQDFGLDSCQINSLNDGIHSKTSLHYDGGAADLDTHDGPPDNRVSKFPPGTDHHEVAAEIKRRLGGLHFDVIFHNTHIHLEYQPRG